MIDAISLNNALREIKNDTVVVTFVDVQYLNLFKLFYAFWKRHGLQNLLVVSLDEKVSSYLIHANINYVYYDYSIQSRHMFWRVRLQIIDIIFTTAKKTLIHTDVDCFWFKNLLECIQNCPEDVCYSTGGTFPKNIADKYGFVLCCGFFGIKYNNNTKNYFQVLGAFENRDDQISTNEIIFSSAKQIIKSSFNKMFFAKILLPNFNVECIKPTIITRWKTASTDFLTKCYGFHPYLTGSNETKFEETYSLLSSFLTDEEKTEVLS